MSAAPSAPVSRSVDVLIVGAGPVGMTLALALKSGPFTVELIDRRPLDRQQGDPRALALSHGARQLLDKLGAWPHSATPIETIHVSQQGGFGRTVIERDDYGLPALGYVARYGELAAALLAALPGDAVRGECEIVEQGADGDAVAVSLRHAHGRERLKCRLVVHAEGTPTDDAAVCVRAYDQEAIVAEVRAEGSPASRRRAWERFTPDGPLALLPLDAGYALVLTMPPRQADETMALDDDRFLAALQRRFGDRLRFVATGPRARFPLALRKRRNIVDGPQVWIGNAAQTLHPVTGQGFNLGLRDAWQLAAALLAEPVELRRAAADYAAVRRLDRWGSATFTDTIVRLFSNDLPPLRAARGIGLCALDVLPPLRHFVAKRMIWGARAWP